MPINASSVLPIIIVGCALFLMVVYTRTGEWILVSAWACFGIYQVLAHLFDVPEIPRWFVDLFGFVFALLVIVHVWKKRIRPPDSGAL